MKTFNSIEEMKPYYDEEKNLFYINDDIKLNFDLQCCWNINVLSIGALNINARSIIAGDIEAWNINARRIIAIDIDAWNINAWSISALDINAWDINALDIDARNIDARDISYYAVCFAYKDIKCKSIKGRRNNCKHFVLDGRIIIKEEKQ